jgi:hypothetical protein
VADRLGADRVHCVVTDTDINRVWVPVDPRRCRVHYFAPSLRVLRRLQAYGVPPAQIELTGYPLPGELLGGPELPVLERNLAARLVRLDPQRQFRATYRDELDHVLGDLPREEEGRPPLVTFAVGGAGAQAELARAFLPGFAPRIREGRLRVALVAGIRREVAGLFRRAAAAAGLDPDRDVEILLVPGDVYGYVRRFNELLARTDVLWTKPSELTFFGALGIPLVFSRPVGVHERYNRRWAIEAGAGLRQRDPRFAAEWLGDWLQDGTLAGAAWSGFRRLPKLGLYRIVERLGFPAGGEAGGTRRATAGSS